MAAKKKAKRGRPKGSKNKAKTVKKDTTVLSDRAEDCVVAIARESKIAGPAAKKLYLKTVQESKQTEKEVQDRNSLGEDKAVTDFREVVKAVKKRAVGGAIKDTKLGVTMVLTHKDCAQLGLNQTMKTREAIRWCRKELGLPEKPQR